MSTEILSQTRQRTGHPPRYKVLLVNDDYTPTDFVLYVLRRFFHKDEAEATRIMLEAHRAGLSLAGVYPFELAETRVDQAERSARQEGYPLRLALEPE